MTYTEASGIRVYGGVLMGERKPALQSVVVEPVVFCECSDCGNTWEQEPADDYKCERCKSLDVIVAEAA